MQGLITIDFGNTHPHAGLFQKNSTAWQLLKVVPFPELALYLKQFEMTPHNSQMVLSEVKAREENLQPFIDQGFLLTRVKNYWKGERFAGMPVSYAKSLGEDRLIEAHYIYKTFKRPSLIIDAGTYVTLDVVSPLGFLGGFITPGLETYFNMFQKGEQLKSVTLEHDFSLTLPRTTADAMTESYTAFAALANRLVDQHQLETVYLTGGNAEVWKTFLKINRPGVPVFIEPHLIHQALHQWFTTQIEPV
jgi:pantothenate kinase type III